MLAYSIKDILELVPEALPFVKQASLQQEMPLDSKDSCIATALEIKYHEKVAYQAIDVFALEKVSKAIKAYGVEAEVASLGDAMVKAANARKAQQAFEANDSYILKQASFEGDLAGFSDIVKMSEAATELYKEATDKSIIPSEDVLRYSGHGFMDKESAVKALANRYHATGDVSFVKIAGAIAKLPFEVKSETVRDICNTVTQMDKQAGLSLKGYNFYKETVLTKEASIRSALNVMLCGKSIPFEKIARVGKGRISSYMGTEVGEEFDRGAAHFKQAAEAMPRDLQQLLINLTKNI
jgi:hypothetical protein